MASANPPLPGAPKRMTGDIGEVGAKGDGSALGCRLCAFRSAVLMPKRSAGGGGGTDATDIATAATVACASSALPVPSCECAMSGRLKLR